LAYLIPLPFYLQPTPVVFSILPSSSILPSHAQLASFCESVHVMRADASCDPQLIPTVTPQLSIAPQLVITLSYQFMLELWIYEIEPQKIPILNHF